MKISIQRNGMIRMIIMGKTRLKRLFLKLKFFGYPKALNISNCNAKQKNQKEGVV